MKFQPTRRTQILMAGVVLAGAVGAFVLWQNGQRQAQLRAAQQARIEQTTTAAPSDAATARLVAQLNARLGGQAQVFYAAPQPSGAICAYAGARPAPGAPRGPARVNAFISYPDRLVAASDDPNFGRLLASTCPGFPGAPRS